VEQRFQNKRVVITGAGSGIGEAMAREFASEGAEVVIVERDRDAGKTVAASLGGTFAECDVSRQDEVRKVMEEHPPDVLVNNAGISHIGTVVTTSEDDFERVFNVNVKGVYNALHAALPGMIDRGGGVILNMASVASKVGLPDRFAYSMSKAAVHSMTLCVARDHVDEGIRCNCLCPARVHTPFVDDYLTRNYPGQEEEMFRKLSAAQPIGRMAKPEEVAKLATFICSGDAAFVTGAAWDIDGGFLSIR